MTGSSSKSLITFVHLPEIIAHIPSTENLVFSNEVFAFPVAYLTGFVFGCGDDSLAVW